MVGAGPVTFPAQNTELCPLLCGAQHCFSVIMFLWLSRLVAAPGQPSETFLGWGVGEGEVKRMGCLQKNDKTQRAREVNCKTREERPKRGIKWLS